MNALQAHFSAGRLIYGVVPIVAGLDKFTNLLVDWSTYLSPFAARLLPFDPGTFMYIVGVIEIVAGVIVLSPLVHAGALLVALWLVAIALNLVMGGFYDIAVRDLVMAAGAYHLVVLAKARRSDKEQRSRVGSRASEPAHA